MTNNKTKVCESIPYYINSLKEYENNLLIYETLFFLSDECDLDTDYYLGILINETSGWKKSFYSGILNNNIKNRYEPVDIKKNIYVPKDLLYGYH